MQQAQQGSQSLAGPEKALGIATESPASPLPAASTGKHTLVGRPRGRRTHAHLAGNAWGEASQLSGCAVGPLASSWTPPAPAMSS